ncbi:hypothetical protein SERLA73DRAFT_127404 [Serpula lacrymans var. lacrymans S7.3]|uniref:Uncharacterized protein n=2 Tax=Serpula lacrymans var. lacrymans TaxID=341189 RepID=F8QGL7_SERL3|nr:hypothetical protein SERLA73DRAFT_127404 [Serpula lacrymans var. lacrymans S7.3]
MVIGTKTCHTYQCKNLEVEKTWNGTVNPSASNEAPLDKRRRYAFLEGNVTGVCAELLGCLTKDLR